MEACPCRPSRDLHLERATILGPNDLVWRDPGCRARVAERQLEALCVAHLGHPPVPFVRTDPISDSVLAANLSTERGAQRTRRGCRHSDPSPCCYRCPPSPRGNPSAVRFIVSSDSVRPNLVAGVPDSASSQEGTFLTRIHTAFPFMIFRPTSHACSKTGSREPRFRMRNRASRPRSPCPTTTQDLPQKP